MPEPHPSIVPVLQDAGFGGVAKLRHLKVDHGLVTALVERWRPQILYINCFYFCYLYYNS